MRRPPEKHHTGAETPTVSVAIFTYNQEEYIEECINSVLAQQCSFPFEIIIGEDASTDRTLSICQDLQAKHPDKITVIGRQKNVGLIENYRDTLAHCSGRYIAQIAGDDYFTDSLKLQKQFDYLEAHPDTALIYTDCDFLYQETGLLQPAVFENKTLDRPQNMERLLATGGFLAPLTWMYRSECSPLHYPLSPDCADESYAYLVDLWHEKKIDYLPVSTAVRRMLPTSISNNTDTHKIWRYHVGVHHITKEKATAYLTEPQKISEVITQSYLRLYHFFAAQKEEDRGWMASEFWSQQTLPAPFFEHQIRQQQIAHEEIQRLRHKIERKRWWKPFTNFLKSRMRAGNAPLEK